MENSPEVWMPVPNYEGLYEISNHGRFAAIRKDGRFFRKLNDKTHYLSVSVKSMDGKPQKSLYIHTLVAHVFIKPRPDGLVVRHLDGNRYNNKVENLAYGTNAQNVADSVKHGIYKGSNNGRSIINESGAKAIKHLSQNGVTHKMLADSFGVTVQAIYAITSNRNWKDA
jgi:hypothetical protein